MNQNTEQIEVDSMSLCDHLISKGYRPNRSKPNPQDNKKFIYYFEANDAVQQIIDACEPEQDAEADYVESFAKEVADYADSLNSAIKAPEKPLIERPEYLAVHSLALAQKINDAGYLRLLAGVKPNRKFPGKRSYFYEPNDEIQKMIDEYKKERRVKKGWRS